MPVQSACVALTTPITIAREAKSTNFIVLSLQRMCIRTSRHGNGFKGVGDSSRRQRLLGPHVLGVDAGDAGGRDIARHPPWLPCRSRGPLRAALAVLPNVRGSGASIGVPNMPPRRLMT